MKLFLEIADAIETNILNGKLLPEDKLPSVRSMVKKLEVLSGTIQNAFLYLKIRNLIISLISVIAVPVTVFCNFENRIPEFDTIVEKDREHENENIGAEKKDKSEDEEQKVVEHKETEHLQDEWGLSFKDIVLIVGCGIIGMVLCIWEQQDLIQGLFQMEKMFRNCWNWKK